MKRWAIGSIAFFSALLLGMVVTIGIIKIGEVILDSSRFDSRIVQAVEVPELVPAGTSFDVPPIFDPTVDYAKTLPVKLLFPGALHSEEVPYRSGKKWLGLFRDGNDDRLMPATIRLGPIENPDLYDTEVKVISAKRSIFLLSGANDLKVGRVVTLFEQFEGAKAFDLSARKSFGKGETFWWLWIENVGEDGFPQKGSSLMLQQTGHDAQVLRTLPNGCNDCSWELLWVGDLDNDSRLDFLIDVSDHYNVRQPTLFLSSKEYAVYASFRGVGC